MLSPISNAELDELALANDRMAGWPKPVPLPDALLPVMAFDTEFLPPTIAPWVADIADRMQCPPDFVAVAAMVGLGSVLGRKVAIRPQRKTDWFEVPNLWGGVIGRPGAMKSPAFAEALRPVRRLEVQADAQNEQELRDYATEIELFKLKKEAAQDKARKALKSGLEATLAVLHEPEAPKARRYLVNDATYEKLGEILADNPNGVLAHRDELISLLKSLDREDAASARGFFLSAWDGKSGYTFDRIIRGKTRIEAACLSLLGTTQPGRIAEYVRMAVRGGAGDDGLLQRFSLLVWPDQSPEWRDCDRYPDSAAREEAWSTFERLENLTAESVGAETDQIDGIPFLRFDDGAADIFAGWRGDLERKLRGGELFPALESHLSKYRKLVPGLALLNHLAAGNSGPVDEAAILRAAAFAAYLENHARRLYASGTVADVSTAKAILKRIRRNDLGEEFTARDLKQRGWSGLTDSNQVEAGLSLLVEYDWLASTTAHTGGRPKTIYRVNPRGLR